MAAPLPQRLKRGTKFWGESLASRLWTWTFGMIKRRPGRSPQQAFRNRGSEPGSGDLPAART